MSPCSKLNLKKTVHDKEIITRENLNSLTKSQFTDSFIEWMALNTSHSTRQRAQRSMRNRPTCKRFSSSSGRRQRTSIVFYGTESAVTSPLFEVTTRMNLHRQCNGRRREQPQSGPPCSDNSLRLLVELVWINRLLEGYCASSIQML